MQVADERQVLGKALQNMVHTIHQVKDEGFEISEKYADDTTLEKIEPSMDFLSMYGETNVDYGRVNHMIYVLDSMKVDIRDVKRAVSSEKYPYSVSGSFQKTADRIATDVEDITWAVKATKDTIKARLDFLNHCSYMFSERIYGDRS